MGAPVAGALQIDRVKVPVTIQSQGIGYILPKQGQARRLGAPGDLLADQIGERIRRAVPHDGEGAEGGVYCSDDLERGRRIAPIPSKASRAGRLATSATSRVPCSNKGMFCRLPRVFRANTLSEASVLLTTSASTPP
jgi:hypothetical protein